MNARAVSLAAAILASLSQGAMAGDVVLAPHRAVYDFALDAQKNITNDATNMKGRMVYEFTGAPCAGYAVNFRFVIESSGADAPTSVTDLRTANFEAADGSLFRFQSQTFSNGVLSEDIKGAAKRGADALAVTLEKPDAARFSLGGDVVFPSAYLARIIGAAEAGERVLALETFDGSDGGDHAFRTSAVIGRQSSETPDAIEQAIGPLRRWPVVVSYFNAAATGDQTPDYAIAFDLWENGVSSRMRLDYGDFSLKGDLARFEPLPPPACAAGTPAQPQ